MSKIKFGPGGIGPVNQAIANLDSYSKIGLEACEVEFTYSVYMSKEDAIKIGSHAKNLGITLSIHAPYYINLNSKDSKIVHASESRILKCCEIGHYLGAKNIVFHPGFYSGMSTEEASLNIIDKISNIMEKVKENGWDVQLCPEVMGKRSVFGSIEEVSNLVSKTGCGFCIDFAHILARSGGDYEFDRIRDSFEGKEWHCHFSGIEYGDKGERKHIMTPKREWEKILNFLKKLDKRVTIICESPDPVGDSRIGLELYQS